MANIDYEPKQFTYENIELFKSENLGAGSYGVVCKAKCNGLLCAAKIIYPILFEAQDTTTSVLASSHLSPIQRFEQECQFLRQIHHPHIVQYLQTYREPDTGSSILLMELMDENLTHFLQRSQSPVPFHVRVTISLSVALALSFLHSNGIIHRDLSSNNVLLNDGIRAKVTDFGMSMFTDSSGSRTLCPGTVAYMPPEALNEPPLYSNMLDCFSFGAFLIQMCTRLWPEPKARFSSYVVPDPRDPSKTTQAQFAVPEVERRAPHIDLVEPMDLLLPIALDCLKDNPDQRPSANELCARLEALKEREEYEESLAAASNRSSVSDDRLAEIEARHSQQHSLLEAEMKRLRATVDEAHEEIRERNQMLDIRARQLQKVSLSLAEKERENDRLRSSIVREGDSKMKQSEAIQLLEDDLRGKNEEVLRLRQQMDVQAQTIRDQQHLSKNDDYQFRNMQYDLSSKVELIQRLTQQLEQATILVAEKERGFQSKKKEVRSVEQLMQSKIYSFQDTLRAKDKRIQDLEEYLSANEEHLAALQKELQKLNKIDMKEKKKFKPKPAPRFKKDGSIHTYKNDHPAPIKMYAGSTASIGSCVYFRPYNSQEIYKFDNDASRWSTLPEYLETAFTLASVKDNLTCIGGQGSRKLRCLGTNDWFEAYPEMLEERASACAVSAQEVLIVAGGLKSNYSTIASVEILRFQSYTWLSVANLPYPVHGASATVVGDRVFVGGGYYMKSKSLFSVLSCSLPALLAPTPSTPVQKAASFPRDQKMKVWHLTTNLPVCRASFTAHHKEVLVIGGKDNDNNFSNAVYKYSIANDLWEEVAHLETKRSNCLVGNFPNKVMVVGGLCGDGISSDIEFITF